MVAMHQPPACFPAVQAEAREMWALLDANPKLAGPWRQLFNQVKSPRHVLSELLQNADDAGASWARVHIDEANALVFEHDGQDFDEASLSALCNFGISNKKHLHTIGFRGIGFKSVFSLGPRVEVYTPTLAIAFHEDRFTEPVWLDSAEEIDHTRIRVPIKGTERRSSIELSCDRWLETPAPLLFFRSIQRLAVRDEVIEKQEGRPGPSPGSTWITLQGRTRLNVCHFLSSGCQLPDGCLQEVREERQDSSYELPLIQVELVWGLGESGQAFVVLPTDLKLDLPVSFNAPFIQDPGRTGIKSPSQSPTNAWLLRKVGRLLAEGLASWVANEKLSPDERARAYHLLPLPTADGHSMADEASRHVLDGFREAVSAAPILLTAQSEVVGPGECSALPHELHEVWSDVALGGIFLEGGQALLSQHVDEAATSRLAQWQWVRVLSPSDVATRLKRNASIPRPETPEHVARLWSFLEQKTSYLDKVDAKEWSILPIRRESRLGPAASSLVLGGKEGSLSDQEWDFLLNRASLVDIDWVHGVRKTADEVPGMAQAVKRLAYHLGLDQRIGLDTVVRHAATQVFASPNPGRDGLRLARIAAKVNAQVSGDFRFRCEDNAWHAANERLVAPVPGYRHLLPDTWARIHCLHRSYWQGMGRKEMELWDRWLDNRQASNVLRTPLPVQQNKSMYGRWTLEDFCIERGGTKPEQYHYKAETFRVTDFDFEEELWSTWSEAAAKDVMEWATLLSWMGTNQVALEPTVHARIYDQGYKYQLRLECGETVSRWVARLRHLPCLPDTFRRPAVPSQLYRVTTETAPLQDVEAFVHPSLDRPDLAWLLDLLGVQTKPANATALLERIRALSHAAEPPVEAVLALYRALDKVAPRLDDPGLQALRAAFAKDTIIFCEDGRWRSAGDVYVLPSDEVPDAPLVQSSVRSLPLWERVGLARQPTFELALAWLRSLPQEWAIAETETNRLRAILRRAPRRVWEEAGGWLDLSGRWRSTQSFRYRTTAAGLRSQLFPSAQVQVADATMLDLANTPDGGVLDLPELASALTWDIENLVPQGQPRLLPWLEGLGQGLGRLKTLDGPDQDLDADRLLAARLMRTRLQEVAALRVAPQVNGAHKGPSQSRAVLWSGDWLYMTGSLVEHYEEVVAHLVSHFRAAPVRRALEACVDRSPEWIAQYLEKHLNLEPLDGAHPEGGQRSPQTATQEKTGDHHTPTEITLEPSAKVGRPGQPSTTSKRRAEPAHSFSSASFSDRVRDAIRTFVESSGGPPSSETGTVIGPGELPGIWVELDGDGGLLRTFWASEGSFEEGIELPAESWDYLDNRADRAWLLLEAQSKFRLWPWQIIQSELARGRLRQYPSQYRLRGGIHAREE